MVIDAKPKLCLVHTSPHREVDVEIFLMPLWKVVFGDWMARHARERAALLLV
jgi:hypothetical protein